MAELDTLPLYDRVIPVRAARVTRLEYDGPALFAVVLDGGVRVPVTADMLTEIVPQSGDYLLLDGDRIRFVGPAWFEAHHQPQAEFPEVEGVPMGLNENLPAAYRARLDPAFVLPCADIAEAHQVLEEETGAHDEDRDAELRDRALELAVLGAELDAGAVISLAARFESYLRGEKEPAPRPSAVLLARLRDDLEQAKGGEARVHYADLRDALRILTEAA
jgi:hypothetical protein